jgi:hypothetical protein
MKINIKTIPESKHRYTTYGDYFMKGDTLQIRVTDTGKEDRDFSVIVHELVEWYFIKRKIIPLDSIDFFDIMFESKGGIGEPGDAIDSPYRRQHALADVIERIILIELETYRNTSD